jgi:hypothetical protein
MVSSAAIIPVTASGRLSLTQRCSRPVIVRCTRPSARCTIWTLRSAAARHDPDEFRKALPADILDRLLVADGDDVPNGAPVRHPSLAPSWPRPELPSWFFDMRQDADVDDLPEPVPVADPGNGKFTVAPRVKHTVSLGLAIGDAEIAAQGEIPVVTIHGVKIGLRRSDKPTPKLPVWSEPYRPESGKGRKVTDPFKQMAICAALGTVPSFLAGITLPAI